MKKSTGSKRVVVGLCAVLVAVSAFFYAPMDVSASSNSDVVLNGSSSSGFAPGYRSTRFTVATDSHDFGSYSSEYVSVNADLSYTFTETIGYAIFGYSVVLYCDDFAYCLFSAETLNSAMEVYSYSDSFNVDFVCKSSQLDNVYLKIVGGGISGESVSTNYYTLNCTFNSFDVSPLSSSDGDAYQNGYNAGFTAGEQSGYGNGYSQGFADGEASIDTNEIYNQGFNAGKESVDTQSYYDAGYQAGYQVAYQDGYDSGYAEGIKSVQSSPGSWQPFKFVGTNISNVKQYGTPFYVAPYGLDDMEEYASGANGYYHNTVPTVYDGYSTINYIIPFDGVTSVDSNTFRFIMNISNLYSNFDINSGSGSFQNTLMSSEVQEAFITFNGKKYYGNIGKYAGGTQGYVNFDFIVEDVISPVDLQTNSFLLSFVVHNTLFANINASQYKFVGASCAPYVSFNVGSSAQGYAFRVRPYVENDRTSASIQDQTDKIIGSLDVHKEIQQGQLEEQKEQTETQKGIAASIKEFFDSFFDNLINSIIHVIVPTKEEMGELFNRLNDFFSETFGFLYYPFEFIINAFNIFLVADSGTGLTLPAFSIMGYEVWGNQTYDIASEPIVGEIFGFVRMGTGAMLVMWFVNFLKDFFDKRFGGGGS